MAKGAVVFGLFDAFAALVLGDFSFLRMFGIALIGSTVYAIEIPSYFAWIEQLSLSMDKWQSKVFKTLMTVVYFNPIWIARHIFFIYVFTQQTISWTILDTAWKSFLYGAPISLFFNYIIQNHITVKHRFMASSMFSGCMAIFYAVFAHLFK